MTIDILVTVNLRFVKMYTRPGDAGLYNHQQTSSIARVGNHLRPLLQPHSGSAKLINMEYIFNFYLQMVEILSRAMDPSILRNRS